MMEISEINQGVVDTSMTSPGLERRRQLCCRRRMSQWCITADSLSLIPLWVVMFYQQPCSFGTVFRDDSECIWLFLRSICSHCTCPVSLSSFAVESIQNIGKNFLKSYAFVLGWRDYRFSRYHFLGGCLHLFACQSERSGNFYGMKLRWWADFQYAHFGRHGENGWPTCEGNDVYIA